MQRMIQNLTQKQQQWRQSIGTDNTPNHCKSTHTLKVMPLVDFLQLNGS
jgi:hypothetical protein